MEAASFTAWQLLSAKGYKKGWDHYRKGMGVTPGDRKKVSTEEREQTIDKALEVINILEGATNGRA